MNYIRAVLASLIAEEIFMQQKDIGGSGNLKDAVRAAYTMATQSTIRKEIPEIDTRVLEANPFYQTIIPIFHTKETTIIDEKNILKRVNTILFHAQKTTKEFLIKHKELLFAIKDALLEKEILIKEDLDTIVARYEKKYGVDHYSF
jgi:ATP-dependent Zn protease